MSRPDSIIHDNPKSNGTNQNVYSNFSEVIDMLNHVINALGEFKNRYDKKFNFSELSKYLKIPKADVDKLISLILNFQEKYENVFTNYRLKKKIINATTYLVAEKKIEYENKSNVVNLNEKEKSYPNAITLKRDQAKLLSDMIFIFQNLKRGKAFDLNYPESQLLINLKIMKDNHPYLFYNNGNGLIYPSELGIQLGNLIHSYNKSNKKLMNLKFKNTTVIFD